MIGGGGGGGGGGGHGPSQYYAMKQPPHHLKSSPVTWTSNYELNTTPVFSTMLRTVASWDEPFLGRTTCNISNEIPDLNDTDNVLIYMDATKWDPVSEWQTVMDSMSNIFGKYGPMFWNEIIVDLPSTTMKSIISAVFFIIDETMDETTIQATYERAVFESSLLDNDNTIRKPILVVNVTALEYNEPLFTCADDYWFKVKEETSKS